MPEIVEKVEAFATRKLGPLPVVAWVGIGVGGLVVFHLLTGGGSGSSAASPTSGAPIPGDGAGIDGGGSSGGSGTITTPPTPVPTPTPGGTATTVKLSLTGATPLYSASGKLTGSGNSGTYIATKIRLLGLDFYRFTRAGHTTLVRTNAPHIKVA